MKKLSKSSSRTRLLSAPTLRRRRNIPRAPFAITAADLPALVWGLGLTASGGGGALNDGIALAQDMLDKGFASLDANAIEDAPPGEIAVMPGGMGEPSAISGSVLDFVPACVAAIDVLAEQGALSGPITGLLPVEAGPVNAMLALYVAFNNSQYRLYDCDGAGRAVPSLTNLQYDFEGISFSPAGVSSIDASQTEVERDWTTAAEAEAGLRDVIDQYGGAIGLCAWPQSGSVLGTADLCTTTFSGSISTGSLLQASASTPAAMAGALTSLAPSPTYASLIWNTTFDDIVLDSAPGYDKGYIVFNRNDPAEPGTELRLYFLNENMFIAKFETATGTFLSYVATAPSVIAPFFSDPSPPAFLNVPADSLIPYNTGDMDRIQTLKGREMVVAVLPPTAKTQYSTALKQTYVAVLNDYFGPEFVFSLSDIYPRLPE